MCVRVCVRAYKARVHYISKGKLIVNQPQNVRNIPHFGRSNGQEVGELNRSKYVPTNHAPTYKLSRLNKTNYLDQQNLPSY